MGEFLRASLIDPVDRDHRQSEHDFRRRQIITGVVTLIGAGLLGWGLNTEPGSTSFYVATFAVAGVWTVGAFASGPLHLGRIRGRPTPRRPLRAPLLIGLGLAAVFVLGAVVVRQITVLEGAVDDLLAFIRQGSGPLVLLILVVNGIAEELFFRGALYAAVPRRQVVVTTFVYTLATVASGNLMLGFAALVVGLVVGLQRAASGGVLAPIITHLSWSVSMFLVLPVLFD